VTHDGAAAALLNGLMLRAAFKVLRNWFDVIVVDGPPALEATHARALAAQADATMFLVEWDKTKSADIEKGLARLDVKQARIVFNKTDPERLRLYEADEYLRIEKIAA
jgi:succinoglycan biosynthesis transport protein ExoP